MSPTPEANRDDPKRNEEEEITMPEDTQFIVPDTGNSDDDDEGESNMDLANGGYQMLAQEPGTLSSEEEDEDSNEDNEVGAGEGTIASIPDGHAAASPAQLQQPAVKVPHIDPPEVVERQEVWKGPAPVSSAPMDQEQVEKIKNVMKNIKLPKMNIPSWARLVPEEEWKAQLVEKAVHKDSQSPGNLSSQTKDSQCSSKGKDDPSTSK